MHDQSILHLTVPNIDSWGSKLPGWVSYLPYHLVYFGHKTLSDALRLSHFKFDQILSHESFSGWSIAIPKTLYSLFKSRTIEGTGSSATHPSPNKRNRSALRWILQTTVAMIGVISLPFRWLQSQLGKGDELTALARITP
jgi:hypothetical protein